MEAEYAVDWDVTSVTGRVVIEGVGDGLLRRMPNRDSLALRKTKRREVRMSRQTIRFLHSSDWQLEKPLGGVPEVPSELREAFLDAPYLAAERVVQAAIDQQVDFVVLTGNLLTIETASPYTFEFLLRQFQRLSEQEITVYWLGGQHDDLDLWPAQLDLPPHVKLFPVGNLERMEYRRDGKKAAILLGQSYRKGQSWRSSDFAGSRESVPRIALAYGEASKRSLESKEIDYWALGGQPRHHVLLHGKTSAAYAGSPQGRHPHDTDAHGAVVVELGPGEAKLRLLETDLWRWRREKINAQMLDSLDELQAALIRQLQQISTDSSRFGWLIVWSVMTHGPLAEKLASTDRLQRMMKAISDASVNDARWSLQIEVEPADLPAELYEEDTILGDFLRSVQRMQLGPDSWQELIPYLPESDHRETLVAELQSANEESRARLWRQVAAWGADLLGGDATADKTASA